MFCPYCGKKLPDNTKFCIYCGKPVSNDTSQESMRNMYEVPSVGTEIQDTRVQDVGSEVENQNIRASIPTKKKLSHSKITVGLVVVAVCVALGVGLRFYHDYQLKVKMAEVYKERFGIEVDPNDITLYDSLQDAMADDSWQGGNGLAPSAQPSNELPDSNTNDFPPAFAPIEGEGYSDYLGEYIDEYGRILEVSVGTGEGISYFINIYANQADAINNASPLLTASHGTLEYRNGYMIIAFEDSSGNGLYFDRDNFIEDNYTLYVYGSPYVDGCDMEPFLDTTFYMTEQYIDPMT